MRTSIFTKRRSTVLIFPGFFFVALFLVFSCKKKEVTEKEAMPKKWELLLPVSIYYGSPVLSSDEKTVYTGTSTGMLGTHIPGQLFVAINTLTGKERWKLQLGMN
jgi:outer membrane protein assembly factor BamB